MHTFKCAFFLSKISDKKVDFYFNDAIIINMQQDVVTWVGSNNPVSRQDNCTRLGVVPGIYFGDREYANCDTKQS